MSCVAQNETVATCSVEGCGRPIQNKKRGKCFRHVNQDRRLVSDETVRFCSEADCGRPAIGRGMCDKHYQRRRTSEFAARRVCVQCGGESAGKRKCPRCMEMERAALQALRNKWNADGLCIKCGKQRANGLVQCARCSECGLKAVRRRYKKFRAAGRCWGCGSTADAGIHCVSCWFKSKARKHIGKSSDAAMLRRVWDRQGGRCAYTGAILTPGDDASLDHIIPTARGGARDESNLQWTTLLVNRMKSDSSHDDFIALCRLIADRAITPGAAQTIGT